MPKYYDLNVNNVNTADLSQYPLEIAERVWWVGHVLENDAFQCHVYLIEQGEQSILFDPGSKLTFAHTFNKIEQIIPFSHIRYFVCHHQDPDITGALPLIDALVCREDAVIVTHWRAKALLKHYGLNIPFWLIDEHDWQLQLSDRTLKFVLTPYAHFPGAFCTFDTRTGALFSSDIFGAFTEEFNLIAKDESYFECLRPFHEHYMPSREILNYALLQLEKHPIKIILPQHGSIIPEHLVEFIFTQLKTLDCGMFFLLSEQSDILRLSRLNKTLSDITRTMVLTRDFKDIAQALLNIAQRILPAKTLEFYALSEDNAVLFFAPENRYRGNVCDLPEKISGFIGIDHKQWEALAGGTYQRYTLPDHTGETDPCLLLPLFEPNQGRIKGIAIIRLTEATQPSQDLDAVVEQMAVPLEVSLEREVLYRSLDLERQRIYERSIRDPLTGLYTRQYMHDAVQRLFAIHDRDSRTAVAMAMLDIDHFKSVNDTYGHRQGDTVLKEVAAVVLREVRAGDLPIRLGGEEFAIFIMGNSAYRVKDFAERLRRHVERLELTGPMAKRRITVSIGVAKREQGEALGDFIERADKALYFAKNNGRNQVYAAQAKND
ncbi:MAG: diguanylate cyclase [Gammaproteobacteria bacterium]